MRVTLISRLKRLEATTADRALVYRYGCLKALPNDFVGARHVVIVKRESTGSPYCEWCHLKSGLDPLRQVLLMMHAESISLKTTWLYDISEQKIAASRSDDASLGKVESVAEMTARRRRAVEED
jgi:hypothetical protein